MPLAPASAGVSAKDLHAQPSAARPAVLDLRAATVSQPTTAPGLSAQTPTANPTPQTPTAPTVAPALPSAPAINSASAVPVQPNPAPAPVQATPAIPIKASAPIPSTPPPVATAPAALPNEIRTAKVESRLSRAANVPKSDLVQKFGAPAAANTAPSIVTTTTPAAPAAPATSQPSPAVTAIPTPALMPTSPSSTPSVVDSRTSFEAPAVAPDFANPSLTPSANAAPAPQQLPNVIASKIAGHKDLLPPTAAMASPSATSPKPATIAAAALAVAIMGGYIWAKNYPNMSLRVASRQAGFEASLPNYLPSSYSLSQQIDSKPNQITLRFNSPAADQPMTLSQTRTSWDSRSLLENYVSRKTDKYLTVRNRGLTIYLYNGNQASWVNRGVWYALEGNSRLNREQILKIIDSL
jgi:hypothetical protein